MPLRHPDLLLIAAATALATSCGERAPGSRGEVARSCDTPGVRAVVEQLGDRLKRVSLQAPESILVREIRQVYGPLVTSSLLDVWIAEPTRAPGRQVSSPWPERIEIRAVEAAGDELCRLEGEVIYVTSVERTTNGAAFREPVIVWVKAGDGWQITRYQIATASPTDSTSLGAKAVADVIRRYYATNNALRAKVRAVAQRRGRSVAGRAALAHLFGRHCSRALS